MNDIIKAGFKRGFEKGAGTGVSDLLAGLAASALVGGGVGALSDTKNPLKGAGWGATQGALMPVGFLGGVDIFTGSPLYSGNRWDGGTSAFDAPGLAFGGMGGTYGAKKLVDALWGY